MNALAVQDAENRAGLSTRLYQSVLNPMEHSTSKFVIRSEDKSDRAEVENG